MECNKEEALHAKEIALRKLKTKDFLGAKRIALKAQRLYPKLQNLSQMLTICEVHCAAEVKVNGYMDWYGILQVEATADETIIRKGYEKLAFLLHPGKNSLPSSAQAAFNLISEAHTILCDHVKRSRYDIKRQCGPQVMSKQTIWPSDDKSDVLKHIPPSDCVKVFWTICPHCRKRFVYHQRNLVIRCEDCSKNFFAFNLHEEAVPSIFLAAPNNSHVPSKMFASHKHGVHSPQVRYSKLYPTGGSEPMMHTRQKDEHVELDCRSDGNQEGGCSETRSGVVDCLATNLIHSLTPSVIECTTRRMMPDPPDPNFVATQNLSREDAPTVLNDAGSNSLERSGKRKKDDSANNSQNRDSNNKRVKNYNSLSDAGFRGDKMSSDNAAGTDSQSAEDLPRKVDNQGNDNATHEGDANCGRGKMSSDIVVGSNNQSSEHHNREVDSQRDGNATQKFNANSDTVSDQGNINSEATDTVGEKSCYSRCLSMPVPNIFDFQKFREVTRFEVGQIWAVYDNLDGMPRFYARILQLDLDDASDFKVHSAWLEHDAANKEEEKWTDEELPVACGKFFLRKTRDISSDRSMFSHIVPWMEGKERNSYVIHPIKGEVWALYKGWSMEWSLDAGNHRSYEYEVVKVLSNSISDGSATVIPLVRIEGFVSLFATARDDKFSFTIASSELLQFSHRIPFYRTTGNENVGVPVPGGFLELDTAALPTDLNAAFPSVTLESYMSAAGSMLADLETDSTSGRMVPETTEHIAPEKNHCSEAHLHIGHHKDISSEQQDTSLQKHSHGAIEFGDGSSQHNSLYLETFTYPESAFHDFEDLRSCAKFERGQIWALYSDVDRFPKFYGWVSEVEMDPFRVCLTWLEACSKEEQEEQWLEQGAAAPSCGTFQVRNFDWRETYDTTYAFSHVVNVRETSKKWQFEIRPQVGEIWVIYMNCSPSSRSDGHAEYAVGEIRRCTKSSTMFEFLTKVDGYVAVFKHDDQKRGLKIPVKENLMRFSHQIPAFRLTEENGGELRDFYELDPAAVPEIFLSE